VTTDSVREQTAGKSYLPFFLIMAGFGVYFIAIAAFASFPGVAIGIFVIVLGAVVYTCRGLGGQAGPYSTERDDPLPAGSTVTTLPSSFDSLEEDEFALPEAAEETAVYTKQVSAAV
jgi:hypothetical protein